MDLDLFLTVSGIAKQGQEKTSKDVMKVQNPGLQLKDNLPVFIDDNDSQSAVMDLSC